MLPACSKKDPAKGDATSKDAPSSTTDAAAKLDAPKSADAPDAEDAKDTAEPGEQACRVIANITSMPKGETLPPMNIALITLGETPKVEVAKGWIARGTDDELHALHERQYSRDFPIEDSAGNKKESFQELWATRLGTTDSLLMKKARSGGVDSEDDDTGMGWYEYASFTPKSLIGPYMTVDLPSAGYLGGAHEYDDTRVELLAVPSGVVLDVVSKLDDASIAAINERITSDERERGVPDDPLPKLGDEDTYPSKAGFAFSYFSSVNSSETEVLPGFSYHSVLSCCSWAENRNQHMLEAPLEAVPDFLSEHLSLPKADAQPGPSVGHPQACAAVRAGAAGEHQVPPAGAADPGTPDVPWPAQEPL